MGGSGSVGAGGSFPRMGGFLEVSREQLLIARKAQLWLTCLQIPQKAVPYGFLRACVLSCFSCILLFATPWTVSHQALLSMEFSRQELLK